MIYILTFILWSGSNGDITTLTQEYNTPQACNIAANEIRRQLDGRSYTKTLVATCTPKGEKK